MQQLFRVSVKRPENDSYLNPLEPKVFFSVSLIPNLPTGRLRNTRRDSLHRCFVILQWISSRYSDSPRKRLVL